MRRAKLLFLCILSFELLQAQPKTDALLRNILTTANNAHIGKVINHPDTYRVQIIYTQINRNKRNKPSFKNYYFNYDPGLYFNPASMVKMPLAFLSLEKLNELDIKGVNKYTPVVFDSSYPRQKPLYKDSSSATGFPSIAHFIKRAFLISENDPYNRMYQFMGQQAINRKLENKGYKDVRITRQFMGFTPEQNRHTNAVRFLNDDGTTLYYQPPAYNTDSFDFRREVKLGRAHYNLRDSLVNEPFDFTRHNNIPLEAMQQMLRAVLFPQFVPARQRFKLTKDDYDFLRRYLSQYPSETPYPKYDTTVFYDSYVKFFFRDSLHRMPAHVRVFNKVGWAYGFITDVSYVVDLKNKTEFMLAATLYVNSDGILNDDRYDDAIGYPFLYNLGQAVYEYELKRKRIHRPDLSSFHLQYEHREQNDKRPAIKEADN